MKIILIDDHGATAYLSDKHLGEHPVMLAAQEYVFFPCPQCGEICFNEDMDEETRVCKYCTGEYEQTGITSDDLELFRR